MRVTTAENDMHPSRYASLLAHRIERWRVRTVLAVSRVTRDRGVDPGLSKRADVNNDEISTRILWKDAQHG